MRTVSAVLAAGLSLAALGLGAPWPSTQDPKAALPALRPMDGLETKLRMMQLQQRIAVVEAIAKIAPPESGEWTMAMVAKMLDIGDGLAKKLPTIRHDDFRARADGALIACSMFLQGAADAFKRDDHTLARSFAESARDYLNEASKFTGDGHWMHKDFLPGAKR